MKDKCSTSALSGIEDAQHEEFLHTQIKTLEAQQVAGVCSAAPTMNPLLESLIGPLKNSKF